MPARRRAGLRAVCEAVLEIWRMMREARVKCSLGWIRVLEGGVGTVTAGSCRD